MTTQLLSDIRFSQFELPSPVQQGLDDAGFSRCTLIQARALPNLLAGRDVAGQAQTGTGKTAAFLVAMYTQLLSTEAPATRTVTQPRALILAPTRELAIQIHKDAVQLGRHTGFELGLIYGGTDYVKQRGTLTAGVDVLIGTPGRIIDYFKQKVFDLRAIEILVLDEADRMFDLGFIKDIRFLLRRMPKPEERLSMLFSATLSYRVMELAYEHMDNPELIKIESDQVTADNVRQIIYYPSNADKIPLLIGLLRRHRPERTMIFVNTKHVAEKVAAWLTGNDYKVALLSGDVPQRKRQTLLQGFLSGEYPLLVATDVASRGLHIPAVSHIINFDLPESAEDYVHRIGRTARAGAEGDAISFACEDYAVHLPDIEEFLNYKIPAADVEPELLAVPRSPAKIERKPRLAPAKAGAGRPGRRRTARRTA